MKNVIVAVLLAILLVYSLGCLADSWMGLNISFDNAIFSPLWSMAMAACMGIGLVMLGFIIALSVFGVLVFVVGAVFVGILVAGIGVFWPAIVLLLIVCWLLKEKKPAYR